MGYTELAEVFAEYGGIVGLGLVTFLILSIQIIKKTKSIKEKERAKLYKVVLSSSIFFVIALLFINSESQNEVVTGGQFIVETDSTQKKIVSESNLASFTILKTNAVINMEEKNQNTANHIVNYFLENGTTQKTIAIKELRQIVGFDSMNIPATMRYLFKYTEPDLEVVEFDSLDSRYLKIVPKD